MSIPDVVTVFNCPCTKYIVTPSGLDQHLQSCQVLLNQVTSLELEEVELSTTATLRSQVETSPKRGCVEVGNVSGVKIIEFYLPKLLLTRWEDVVPHPIVTKEKRKSERSTEGPRKRIRSVNTKFIDDADDDDDNIDLKPEQRVDNDWSYDESFEDLDKGDEPFKPKKNKRRRVGAKPSVADDFYPYQCNICPHTKFQKEERHAWHMENIHGESSKQFEIINCPICLRMFNKRLALQSHLKNHENNEALEEAFSLWTKWPTRKPGVSNLPPHFCCKYCMMPHRNQHSFLTHMATFHHEKGRFPKYLCPHCQSSEFDSMKLFIVHLRRNHRETYYGTTVRYNLADPRLGSGSRGHPKTRCPHCNKTIDVYYMKSHIERKHSSKPDSNVEGEFRCPIEDCRALVKTQQQLKAHFILHLENNPYACPVPGCKVRCDAQCHLDRHMRLHKSELLQCSKCQVYYSRKDKLEKHTCIWDKSKLKYDDNGLLRPVNAQPRIERISNDNDSEGKVRRKVNINLIISQDPVYLQVTNDNPGFEQLLFGNRLVKMSKGNRPMTFDCTDCSTRFYDKKGLQMHGEKCVKLETTEGSAMDTIVGCPLCGLSFGNKNLLSRHAHVIHKPTEVFICSQCDFMFSTKTNLQNHLARIHAGGHSCSGCSQRFPTHDELNLHKAKCSLANAECTECGKILANQMSLRRHWLLIHGREIDPYTEKSPGLRKGGRIKNRNDCVRPENENFPQGETDGSIVKIEVCDGDIANEHEVSLGMQVPLDIIVKTEVF